MPLLVREVRDANLPHIVSQEPQPLATARLRNLRMRARDGVTLVADAARPLDRGRYPVILERTAVGRESALANAEFWASRGYVYVAQDCRGRGDSGGVWRPFVNEGHDGFDAVAWAARQPWCDGNVAMLGDGYAGTAQMLAAAENPPALRCMVPRFAMGGLPFDNGVFDLYGSLRLARIGLDRRSDGSLAFEKLPSVPLSELDRAALGRTSPVYQAWFRQSPAEELLKFKPPELPALYVSGWRDPFGVATMNAWRAVRGTGRRDQWLVYGPWASGSEVPTGTTEVNGLTLRFMDTFLKGRAVELESVPRVQAFVTVANQWTSLEDWPSTSATFETRYLAPSRMVAEAGEQGSAVYVYNPALDVAGPELPATKVKLPSKGTYALFTGDVTAKATAIAGPFEVRLFFKSSAGDTDLFASLLDQAPDGSMWRIARPGKVRAAYRNGGEAPDLLKPGRIYVATLRPWDAAYELPKGHRLGLLVQSSLLPRYARNFGTGEPLATAKGTVSQRNVILTGRVTPSRITFRRLW